MRAHVILALGVAAAAASASSCSWTRFDDLRGDAKARALGDPFGSADFGGMLAVAKAKMAGGRPSLLAANPGLKGNIAFYSFTEAGSADELKMRGGADTTDDQSKLATTSAPLSGIAAAPDGDMAALLGNKTSQVKRLYLINFDVNGKPSGQAFATPQFTPGWGDNGLAMGDVYRPIITDTADVATDTVVLGERELFIFPQKGGGSTVGRCKLTTVLTSGRIAIADMVAGVDNFAEVIVGAQYAGGPGDVTLYAMGDIDPPKLISDSLNESAKTCTVRGTKITAPAAEPSFGKMIAVAQVIGGPELDLIVGAPGENVVYIFAGSATGPLSANPKMIRPGSTGGFGSAATAVDFDGDGKNELAVGEPAFVPPGGSSEAGRVLIYGIQADTPTLVMPALTARDFDSEHFGRALTAIRFTAAGKTVDQLVVGEQEAVIVYFDTNLRDTASGVVDADERVR